VMKSVSVMMIANIGTFRVIVVDSLDAAKL